MFSHSREECKNSRSSSHQTAVAVNCLVTAALSARLSDSLLIYALSVIPSSRSRRVSIFFDTLSASSSVSV